MNFSKASILHTCHHEGYGRGSHTYKGTAHAPNTDITGGRLGGRYKRWTLYIRGGRYIVDGSFFLSSKSCRVCLRSRAISPMASGQRNQVINPRPYRPYSFHKQIITRLAHCYNYTVYC